MTQPLRRGNNLVNPLDTRLITLLWLAGVVVAESMVEVVVQVGY
jgi:hypothetical protein